MKQIEIILSLLLLIVSVQSCSKRRHQQVFRAGQTIHVLLNTEKFPPLDSFISEIKVVPLETNDNCLIGRQIFSVKQHNDLIYINSDLKQLLVFDLNGNFIREIGKIGQGPGEFINLRDFIFTNEGTIEILDFKKIESYTMEGKHIGTKKRFDFLGKDFYCNPINFCRSFSSGYYLWGGIVGLRDEELRKKSQLMYRVNDDMQVEEGYFDTKYGDGGLRNRFMHYQDYVLVAPSAFDYNIYQIDSNDSVSIRYSFDFGKYGFDSSKDVDRETIDFENYVRGIGNYSEVDRFLYFVFIYQKVYSLLYSKETGHSFIHTLVPSANGEEFRLFPIETTYNEQLIAIQNINVIKFELDRMSQENIKKWGLEECLELDDEDNPVLIFYTTKL